MFLINSNVSTKNELFVRKHCELTHWNLCEQVFEFWNGNYAPNGDCNFFHFQVFYLAEINVKMKERTFLDFAWILRSLLLAKRDCKFLIWQLKSGSQPEKFPPLSWQEEAISMFKIWKCSFFHFHVYLCKIEHLQVKEVDYHAHTVICIASSLKLSKAMCKICQVTYHVFLLVK